VSGLKAKHKLAYVEEVFFAFCKGADTPRSLKAWLLFTNNEWKQLAEFAVHPTEYNDSDSFAIDYGVTSFLKKNKDLPKAADTRAEAIRRFKLAEIQCRDTNERFIAFREGRITPTSRSVTHVIHRAQDKLLKLLSQFRFDSDLCSWGNGATSCMKRAEAYIDHKLTRLPLSVSPRAARHALGAITSDLHWSAAIAASNPAGGRLLTYTNFNIFDTVRKTVLTDRSIGKEPTLNGFLQKGAGLELRRLLLKVGIDLTDQSQNQTLAMMAYDLDLATLDLAMASDCLSTEVVAYFCPIDLFTYLDEIRSTHTLLDGESVKLEKFSSMGNAFTFELESLIFWSVVSTVSEMMGRTIFGVYGDDLICHKQCVELIVETLRFIGFDINTSKSFTEGNFFESCGKHYYAGRDVTPLYQKTCPTSPEEGLRMANRIIRYAARLGQHRILDKRMRSAWECCVRLLRLDRYAGPILLEGDGHLEVPFSSLKLKHDRNRGYRVLGRRAHRRMLPGIPEALYALKLREIYDPCVGEIPHDSFTSLPTERHFRGREDARSDDVESRQILSYYDGWGWVNPIFVSHSALDW
jgi:hypothetical protein